MPSARHIDVQASRPAPRPWITGRSTKPNSTENANTERIATLAHRRQGRSRGSGASLTLPALVDAVHQRLRRFDDEELRERIAVGEHHEDKDERVPQPEAVEGRRHARRG